jgi:hypothetical protein
MEINKVVFFGPGMSDFQPDWNIPHSSLLLPSAYLTTPNSSQLFLLRLGERGRECHCCPFSKWNAIAASGRLKANWVQHLLSRGAGVLSDWEFICGFQPCPCHHILSTEYLHSPHTAALEQGTFCLPQEDGFIHFGGIIILNSWSLLLTVSLLTHFCFISLKSHG